MTTLESGGRNTTKGGEQGAGRSFEQVYTQLEAVVQQLEDGGLPLDDAISLFEQGMLLARQCKALLDGAELRMTMVADELRGAGAADGADDENEEEQ